MARKIHTKQERTREEFLVAKNIGAPIMMNTLNGKVLLNIWKHFCYHKPYKNDEYQNLMYYEIKKRKEAYNNSRKEGVVATI